MIRSIVKCQSQSITQQSKPIQLPKSSFILRIISLSFNRPDVHQLLSKTYSSKTALKYQSSTYFKLISIHQSNVHTHTNPILTNQIKNLSSCFSLKDQLLWKKKRIEKITKLKKPRFELRLSFSLKIKETHKSAVIRKNLRKKWIAALKLIVQYGANQNQVRPELIDINPELAKPEDWLLKDYYYIVHPNISLHQLTIPQLIPIIRTALLSLIHQSKQRSLTSKQYQPHPNYQPNSNYQPNPNYQSRPPQKLNHQLKLSIPPSKPH
ncbi:hypothetical protein DFH28DRAFT_957255 [Melampsora americana]|nr:hypothetical protein DFH28DRAFT_957255 [Melampsora americana]